MSMKLTDFLIFRNESIKQAMKKLSEFGEKQLIVVDDNQRLIGALSDGDIRRRILQGGSIRGRVEVICNKNPVFVNNGYSLDYVRTTMLKLKIEVIPVINADKKVEEVLTWDEVFAGQVSKQKERVDAVVVVMAGGKGTRLDPFTRILPKPLIPIGEKPIIEVIMDKFNGYGIKDFYVSVNFKSRMIKSYFEEANESYTIHYIEEKMPLGTIGSLKLIEGKIKSPFFVTNCDVLIDVDYAELMRFHQDFNYDLTLTVSCKHYVIPYGVCEIKSGGILKKINEKPSYDFLVNTGLYLMNPKVISLIPKNKFFNFNDLVKRVQKKKLRIGVFPIPESSWVDVGHWEEYSKTLKMVY